MARRVAYRDADPHRASCDARAHDPQPAQKETHVDVRIGVIETPKELEVLLSDDADPEKVRAHVEAAVTAGTTLWLTD
jgi:hypothetical protein